ncbi:beta-glucuronidase-like isoform X2 [Haliotis rubra]|uniref:beta-glucuronidase-like isoform X2 n=1 Tax=Haliotis rubra TaxID=36100 RepID=UPI001EE5AF96|nr:beta-glucuronidase-like isoform X2 [Haliotis rubra]
MWAGVCVVVFLCVTGVVGVGMLYPRDSESREVRNLDGMWNFRADMSPTRNAGLKAAWFKQPLAKTGPVIPMPVPSSYNDVTQDISLRDFVGWVWYDRDFFVPQDWQNRRVVLRFGSANYYAIVWVNAQEVVQHNGGHLPFEAEINKYLHFGGSNLLTVAVNNTLTQHTLPPGTIQYQADTERYPDGYFVQNLQMDFFNYAGIHRHVRLYTTPTTYIDDVTVTTNISNGKGIMQYQIDVGGSAQGSSIKVDVEDKDGNVVGTSTNFTGTVTVANANLWYPYTMMPNSPAYLYTLKMTLTSKAGTDVYRLPVGIRTIQVTDSQVLINNRPFYCHGIGKHEDADIRGRGLDYATIAKDFNMFKWLGVNCFRTSVYPYAEEIMDQADQEGIMVIDESPGIGITQDENFSNTSLFHHLEVMDELVRRDKNRPAVMMWSVANEPGSDKGISIPYFKSVIGHTRSLDPTRPVSFVSNKNYIDDKAVQFVDIICFNRYYAWYTDTGHTEVIQVQMASDMDGWRSKYNKPLFVTEYGAGSVAGLHRDPSSAFTEEYQVDFMAEYHKQFDSRIGKDLVGEMVWTFSDFITAQGVKRVVGNKKGVLTRQRQPKPAAFLLRQRYQALINRTAH